MMGGKHCYDGITELLMADLAVLVRKMQVIGKFMSFYGRTKSFLSHFSLF